MGGGGGGGMNEGEGIYYCKDRMTIDYQSPVIDKDAGGVRSSSSSLSSSFSTRARRRRNRRRGFCVLLY